MWSTLKIKPVGKKARGMAIPLVLVFSMALLILGSAYLKTLGQVKPVNPKMLEQVQADFFAQGIQRIALLKFKKYPADFYHAYLRKVEKDAGKTLPALVPVSPEPMDSFLGGGGSILQNQPGMVRIASMTVSSYATDFRLITHSPYKKDGLEIQVNVDMNGIVRQYTSTIDASRTRSL